MKNKKEIKYEIEITDFGYIKIDNHQYTYYECPFCFNNISYENFKKTNRAICQICNSELILIDSSK